jgi:hypothetical protein
MRTVEGTVDAGVTEALRAACRGERAFDILWVGDSISELNPAGPPLFWQVGDLLTGRRAPVQYLSACDDPYTRTLATAGTEHDPALAGLGGRSSRLEPGERASAPATGRSLRLLWTRQPGGGELAVRWGDEHLGVIATAGPRAWSRLTALPARHLDGEAELVIEAMGAPVDLEGVHVHDADDDAGVRVWPAVRSGARSRQFTDHRGWVLDAVGSIRPDLIVVATGTNDDEDYRGDLGRLVDALRVELPGVPVDVFLPPLSKQFTAERAEVGREVARRAGCGIIDAAADLGVLPTVDGVHLVPFSVAMTAQHAAGVLRGESSAGWVRAIVDGFAASSVYQTWRPGVGSISIGQLLYTTMLVGRTGEEGEEHATWGIVGPPFSEKVLGLEGPVFGMGPGGGEPTDTYLSRTGPGVFGVNGGRGELAVGAIRLAPRDGAASDEGLVIELDPSSPAPRLALRTPTGALGAGLELPLPCALAAHDGALGRAELTGGVLWVPFPPLAAPSLATHVWLDVVEAELGAGATAAVVASREGGLPGSVLAATAAGAVDLGVEGVTGAALTRPVEVPCHRRWWVAVAVDRDRAVVLRGARSLLAALPVHLGAAPVTPGRADTSGALVTVGSSAIGDDPEVLEPHVGTAPTVHVSLEGAPRPQSPVGN